LPGVDDEGYVWGQRFGEEGYMGVSDRLASYLAWVGGKDGKCLPLAERFVVLVEVVMAAAVAVEEERVVVAEGRIVLGAVLAAVPPEAGDYIASAASVEIEYPLPQRQVTNPSRPP